MVWGKGSEKRLVGEELAVSKGQLARIWGLRVCLVVFGEMGKEGCFAFFVSRWDVADLYFGCED